MISILSNFIINIKKFYNKCNIKGLDVVNDYFPPIDENADLYSERFKTLILAICAFSFVMMFISPLGYLYACYPRPFYMFILYAMRLPNLPEPPTPEWGIHYLTLFTYMLSAYIAIEVIENYGIKKPFHKITYVIFLTLLTFFVPFEFTYITLYDFFHNLPVNGYLSYWTGSIGFTSLPYALTHSVMINDIVMSSMSLIGLYLIRNDLKNFYDIEPIKFNKISKILFSLFVISMFMWVILPIFDPTVTEWGTKWFPQTIYVKYGNYTDYGIDTKLTGEDTFGIVEEFWFPNDNVKYANHITKIFSVMFMFYTFIPKVKKHE